MPAFQPYWGKPAVRNDREDRGNVGIIRSPIRASIPPDLMYGPAGRRKRFSSICRMWVLHQCIGLILERVTSALDQKVGR